MAPPSIGFGAEPCYVDRRSAGVAPEPMSIPVPATRVVDMNPQHWGPPGGPGFESWSGGPPLFVPFLGAGMFVLTLLLLAGLFFLLARKGKIGPPPWVSGGRFSPEYDARKTLADRFAAGEIDTDEFLERASVLNWTPGVNGAEDGPPGPRR
jgi:putative membrane protein